ncbi:MULTISPECIES: DsbA family protein [Aeromonas]|jgi:protein-disulfide isomerase|uniref:Copper resistance protein n=1 Tax=Aeromonas veronii TaxID=654 RepID=A0A2T4N5N1_AERVE|nr:DsbA family protein [Aeromonas veronii]MBA2797426.1 DsbA family protein [Aeromonas veronii]MCX0442189.1 DsbA family protein [Aeromonas veronii]PTH82113.1 copper resistance protein [Aeromonas veronii]RDE63993.1 DsbA family protein [Aeromonas veronii]UJP35003.1 DsbA family protein [Aeromonas veronii]
MKPTLSALTLLASLSATLLAPALHAAPFTPEQEARIKELIRETLIANPKILDEAAESWEKQNAAAQEAQLGNFIKGNKDVLFNSATSPRLGAKNPKLTLVLFTDYNCPYCKQFDPQLTKLLKAYPDDLGLVIKLLPFKGQTSAKAAQYSLTLWQQDPTRFLTLHDKLMSKQGMLTEADINKALASTGNTALKPAAKATEELRNSLRIGTILGVQGTPATLIGNQLVPGAIPYEELEQLVQAELAKQG